MTSNRIRGIDHVALPMTQTDAMVAFYRALGFDVVERRGVVEVFAGEQKINFHAPELGPGADPPVRADGAPHGSGV